MGGALRFGRVQHLMPRFGAEMGQVDCGHRIGRAQAQYPARCHGDQPLAGAQDGQGAEQPFAIEVFIPGHSRWLALLWSPVHGNVTAGGRDAGGPFGYVAGKGSSHVRN